jgi:hypothetical protein
MFKTIGHNKNKITCLQNNTIFKFLNGNWQYNRMNNLVSQKG